MPLKVVVELQVQAVTCPGVFLPEKHDVFLSECILGQHKETESLRPVFPLLFHEKMCFEKVFESAIDPAAVTEMLEIGDDLAFYEENTGDFLFPECKLTPAYPGVDRELLMETSPHFPMTKEPSEQATSEQDPSSLGTDGSVNYLHYPPSQRDSAFHRAASSATSQHLKSPSPLGSPSAFQNRLLILNQIGNLSDFVL
ncbi:spermatogenesis associated 6-like protein [Aptenodytes patagonicus]|uniref:spermatogenesis associated 6-like protein n=1 Tax=Aptenodytes patagonicus TaxID=9234 RepID=UPI003F9FB4DC